MATPSSEPPRVALISGASAGIGAATARALGALGWSVGLGARRLDRLAALAADVEAAGGRACAAALDVTDADSIDACFAAVEKALGPVDAVVSNAGGSRPGLLHELDAEDLRADVETNLLGAMWLAQRALPSMLARGRGDLVFVSSLNAVLPRPYQVGYTAAKAGVEALARTLAMELQGTGVRASVVRPGPTQTEMGQGWDPRLIQRMLASWSHWGVLHHHRFLSPQDVAAAVVSVLTAPPGTWVGLVEVNPTAPRDGE